MATGPKIKRTVDLVDRGPEDDTFYPAATDNTVFRRNWRTYHNVVSEIAEIGYQGSANWGQRMTVTLTRQDSGDLLEWICIRFRPRSWLGASLERQILSGAAQYADLSGAWMWADSLGSAAIQLVELEIGDTVIDKWSGEWMDIWSRSWLDLGRAPAWDADIFGKLPTWTAHDASRPAWTTVLPTEDGYVYSWLPLTFLRRPRTAFPLAAMGDLQEIRLHITFRPFADVVRRRLVPRSSPLEVPLGSSIVVNDVTGLTPIPCLYVLPLVPPDFEEATVFAGIVQTEDPLRSAYMRIPIEMIYEPVMHLVCDVEPGKAIRRGPTQTILQTVRLDGFNGPLREIIFFLRRKAVWQFNEWTNYGALLEPELAVTAMRDADAATPRPIVAQLPLLTAARLIVGNAVWRDETERWWRIDYGLEHRGGVRLTDGMVYGYIFGAGSNVGFEDLQPAGTVNASRADLRLELEILPPEPVENIGCDQTGSEWEVHVFGVGLNWLRFVNGLAVPIFKD